MESFNRLIKFRQVEKTDLSLMLKWRNQDSVRAYTREYRMLNESDQDGWFDSYISSRRSSDGDQELYIIEIEYNGGAFYLETVYKQIGVCGFTRVEWHNRKAEITFYIGEDKYRTPDVIIKCLTKLNDIGFNEFGFHKLYWPVYSHDPNLKVYKMVYQQESILLEEYYWNGQYNDRIYLSLINRDVVQYDRPIDLQANTQGEL